MEEGCDAHKEYKMDAGKKMVREVQNDRDL